MIKMNIIAIIIILHNYQQLKIHISMIGQQIHQRLTSLKKILEDNPKIKMIGICGIPGSGKSSITNLIPSYIDSAVILSMDGYHIQRKKLDENGIKRRGAPFTFDMKAFKQKIQTLRSESSHKQIGFPTFDHKLKDPVNNGTTVPKGVSHIFIEGIYTFDKSQGLDEFWDLKIWINTPREVAIDRLAKRHVESEIVENLELGYKRVEGSDKLNMDYILQNCHHPSHQYFEIENP